MALILPYPSYTSFIPATVHSDTAHNTPHAGFMANDNAIKSFVDNLETSVWNQGIAITALQALPASVFTVSYNSGDQQIITNGTLTLTHGLGTRPKVISYILHCAIADNGFSPGDYLDANNFTYSAGGGTTSGLSAVFDASNITIYYANNANVFIAIHKTGRYGCNLANASWRLIINAFA